MYSLFDPFLLSPVSRKVYVVSDSDFQQYQKECAQQEITLLESKRNRYNTAIETIDAEIVKIKETYALLPAKSTEKLNEATE